MAHTAQAYTGVLMSQYSVLCTLVKWYPESLGMMLGGHKEKLWCENTVLEVALI